METVSEILSVDSLSDVINSLSQPDKPYVYVGPNYKLVVNSYYYITNLVVSFDDGRVLKIFKDAANVQTIFSKQGDDFECSLKGNITVRRFAGLAFIDFKVNDSPHKLSIGLFNGKNGTITDCNNNIEYLLNPNKDTLTSDYFIYHRDNHGLITRYINGAGDNGELEKTTSKEWYDETINSIIKGFKNKKGELNTILSSKKTTLKIEEVIKSSFRKMIQDYNSLYENDYDTISRYFESFDNLEDKIREVSISEEELKDINRVLFNKQSQSLINPISDEIVGQFIDLASSGNSFTIETEKYSITVKNCLVLVLFPDGKEFKIHFDNGKTIKGRIRIDHLNSSLIYNFDASKIKYIRDNEKSSNNPTYYISPISSIFGYDKKGSSISAKLTDNELRVIYDKQEYTVNDNEVRSDNYIYSIEDNALIKVSKSDTFDNDAYKNLFNFDASAEADKIIIGCSSVDVDSFFKEKILSTDFSDSLINLIEQEYEELKMKFEKKDVATIFSIYEARTDLPKVLYDVSISNNELREIISLIMEKQSVDGNTSPRQYAKVNRGNNKN